MSEKVKHTPLPWRLGRNGANYAVFAGGERFIADCDTSDYERGPEDDANAAFIVRAVNTQERLIAALKDAISLLNEMCVEIDGEGFNRPDWNALIKLAEEGQ